MLNRTLTMFVPAAALVFFLSANSGHSAGEITLKIQAEEPVILGQENTGPTIGNRVRRIFNNLFGEGEPEHVHDHSPMQINPQPPMMSAIPTQPPKPPTTAEVRQAVTQPQERRTPQGNAAAGNTNNTPAARNPEWNEGFEGQDSSIFNRLRDMRIPIFTGLSPGEIEKQYQNPAGNTGSRIPGQPATDAGQPLPVADQGERTGRTKEDRPVSAATSEPPVNSPADNTFPNFPVDLPSQQIARQIAELEAIEAAKKNQKNLHPGDAQTGGEAETRMVVNPQIELVTEAPQKTVVGQEAVYKIRINNTGNGAAEQIMLSAEIPSWLEIKQHDATKGKITVVPRTDNPEMLDLTWKISRLDVKSSDTLVLRLIPHQRKSVELRIRYDFLRKSLITKVDVQEPLLQLELLGPAEVMWNSEAAYELIVRNTGNGDAEEVNLELLQTNSEKHTAKLPKPLAPGEEQRVEIKVWTGKQEHIDIGIAASGLYNLKSEVKRRIKVLRPELHVSVQTPSVHFVNNTAEFEIRIQNIGTADANNIAVQAKLPLGTQFSEAAGGTFTAQSNTVEWKGKSIAVGAVEKMTLICIPKREGECRVTAVASDHGGELAAGSGTFNAEAVTELDLKVEKPQGPVEVGQTADYVVHLSNTGTKSAENVEVIMAFGRGLEPAGVAGGEAVFDNGQVIFERIPVIAAGQQVKLSVRAKAERAEMAKVHIEVISKVSDIHLENGLSTYIYSRKKGTATAATPSADLQ
ncbi:MAG: DUF11 domain-containing protein [Planctomycetaceae bacterium]|nr:DUF11 domain-containing protein [Planctomycetaceae bacterium]